MPWLVRDGKVLATLEVATSLRHRTRGLLGREGIDGAILLRPARSVHTFRMRFAIDVAFCDRDARVIRVVTLVPNRITMPVRKARLVIECEAGVMAHWGIRAGDLLELRGVDDLDEPPHRSGGSVGSAGSVGVSGRIGRIKRLGRGARAGRGGAPTSGDAAAR